MPIHIGFGFFVFLFGGGGLGFGGGFFRILDLGRVVGTNSHGFNLRPRFLHTTSKNSESDKEHDLHAGLTPFADNYKYAAIL